MLSQQLRSEPIALGAQSLESGAIGLKALRLAIGREAPDQREIAPLDLVVAGVLVDAEDEKRGRSPWALRGVALRTGDARRAARGAWLGQMAARRRPRSLPRSNVAGGARRPTRGSWGGGGWGPAPRRRPARRTSSRSGLFLPRRQTDARIAPPRAGGPRHPPRTRAAAGGQWVSARGQSASPRLRARGSGPSRPGRFPKLPRGDDAVGDLRRGLSRRSGFGGRARATSPRQEGEELARPAAFGVEEAGQHRRAVRRRAEPFEREGPLRPARRIEPPDDLGRLSRQRRFGRRGAAARTARPAARRRRTGEPSPDRRR